MVQGAIQKDSDKRQKFGGKHFGRFIYSKRLGKMGLQDIFALIGIFYRQPVRRKPCQL